MLKTWLFGFLLLFYAAVASAQPDFDRALQSMDQGDYQTASAIYEEAIKQGVHNGHLYYNLGICYQRLNRRGEAVAAFLAARRYLPRNPDVSANLRFVLSQNSDKLEAELDGGWFERSTFWVERFTLREFGYAAAASLAIVSILLLITIIIQQANFLRRYAYWLYLIPTFFISSSLLKYQRDFLWGAVTVAQSKILSGPNKSNTVIFQLQEGAPFAVINQNLVGEYWQIQLSDGKKGWVNRSETQVFAGP